MCNCRAKEYADNNGFSSAGKHSLLKVSLYCKLCKITHNEWYHHGEMDSNYYGHSVECVKCRNFLYQMDSPLVLLNPFQEEYYINNYCLIANYDSEEIYIALFDKDNKEKVLANLPINELYKLLSDKEKLINKIKTYITFS